MLFYRGHGIVFASETGNDARVCCLVQSPQVNTTENKDKGEEKAKVVAAAWCGAILHLDDLKKSMNRKVATW